MRTIGDNDWAVLWLVIFLVIAVAALNLDRRTTEPSVRAPNSPNSKTTERAGSRSLYPPPDATGATDPDITQDNIQETICASGYTRIIRPAWNVTERIKRQRMAQLPGDSRDYELDHVIPLELGGCPTCGTNLWMEPISDALKKDQVEDYLHREVCSNRVSLSEAQRIIAQDWYSIYLKLQDRP